MEPRAVLDPVGPLPPRVYWTRRLVLLVALVIVIFLIAHACAGSGGADSPVVAGPTPTVSPTPSPSPSPSSSRSVATRPVATCRPGQLRVTAATDSTSYDAHARPRLTAVVRNAGKACRYDAAPATRRWLVLSGSDRIWTTADCARSRTAAFTRLPAGGSVSYALVWDRHRSVKGCATPGAAAQPGTYRLYVTVLGVTSAAAVFRLAG